MSFAVAIQRILRRARRREDGAISVLAGISLTAVFAATALGVDIGDQVSTGRWLSKVVDLATLDAGQAIGNRRDPTRNIYDVAVEFAQASSLRNSFTYADTASGNSLALELGIADPVTKTFTPFGPGTSAAVLATANAVRVTATTRTDFHFMPGSSTATKSAIVLVQPKCPPANAAACENEIATAGVMVGSTMAEFDSSASLFGAALGPMVGGTVSLSAVSYQALADTDITLGALWTQLGLDLGSPAEVLGTEVSMRDLLQAQIDILNTQGDAASLEAAVILAEIQAAADASKTFTFGEFIDIAGITSVDSPAGGDVGINTPGKAADASVSVLSMITAAAQVANGTNAVTFALPYTVPGISSGSMTVVFVEPPVLSVGPAEQDSSGNWVTHAETAQTRIALNLTLTDGITLTPTSTVPVTLPIYIEGGSARTDLTALECDVDNTNSVATVAASTDALTASIGTVTAGAMTNTSVAPVPVPATVATLGSGVTVVGSGSISVAGTSQTLSFDGPFDDRVAHVGATSIGLDSLSAGSNFTVTPTGLSTAALAALVAEQLPPNVDAVLEKIETDVLQPMAATPLGITMGGADVSNPSTDCLYSKIIE